jgi:hypothetical protein
MHYGRLAVGVVDIVRFAVTLCDITRFALSPYRLMPTAKEGPVNEGVSASQTLDVLE